MSVPITIAQLHDAFRAGTLKPSGVVEGWLARAEADRGAPVWISTRSAEVLRERGRELDQQLAHSPVEALASPVFGALFALKDNIDCEGLPTTAACPDFSYEPPASSFVVAALEGAGAIAVGKTNLDQFATGLVGTRSPFGAVPNAFDPEMISGGSSSGSAVAVAKTQVHFSLGTDTASSGRVPAGLNNLVGWKPTRGLLSVRGVVPACRALDCVSIFALTVGDAARVFSVAAQFDAADPCARRVPLDRPALRDTFRFAIPRPLQFFGDLEAAAAFKAAVARLESLGGIATEIDFAPWLEVAASLYEGPRVAERHAGIREFFDTHTASVELTVRGIIESGRRFSATDTYAAEARLDQLRLQLANTWKDIDVLLVPTAPTHYSIEELRERPVELNRRMGTYTNFANLLDLAAIAVPAAMRADGMPSGITLVAPAGSDLMLAHLAQRFHASTRLALGATQQPQPDAVSLPVGDITPVCVVGAHLHGLPLNRELTSRGARLVRATSTAPHYRLFALPGTTPPKPGMVRTGGDGHAIQVEIWEMPTRELGSFVAGIPAPLCMGSVELDDGARVHGFLCESSATANAEDISRFGGWRSYLQSRSSLVAPAFPEKETP